jgi:1-deoxy-D-xylulose-5-phosphate synthase
MALAARQQGSDRKVVAVIGDGAMTAGMAFEALNHAGDLDADLLVILNDNDMSISNNVGGLSNYLGRILSGKFYNTMREGSKKVLKTMPAPVWELARRMEEHAKGLMVPGTLFEELGFNYAGPIDGHDIEQLTRALKTLRRLKGPQLLHIVTRKGKGFAPAEENPCAYHGVGTFNPDTGEMRGGARQPSYTDIFGQWLCAMAERDERLIGITPAMCEGSGLVEFAQRFPARYFDVGIAEQHAVTLAAGLACEGLKPVVTIYSTFLQRAYDQLIHDVALQNLPVLFAVDRGGLVGPDGATHAGSFDLSYLRCIPNLLLMAPGDENECRQLLTTGFLHEGPAAVRYPRGGGIGAAVDLSLDPLPVGKGELRCEGQTVALLAFGAPLGAALAAGEKLNATVASMRFVRPLDVDLILQLAARHSLLVTLEDNAVAGGAGSAVNECLAAHGIQTDILNLGLPDRFLEQASREQLLADCGLDADGILHAVSQRLTGTLAFPHPTNVNS